MRPKRILPGLISLTFILFYGCQKEKDSFEEIKDQNDAKLKRILYYAYIDSEVPVNIVAEYEYDEEDRIERITYPNYQDGEILDSSTYDLYEYDTQGLLIKIKHFNSNNHIKNYLYTYSDNGKLQKEYIEYLKIGSFEYSLYKYDNDKLLKIEKYDRYDSLKIYRINEYDNSGNLIKETTFNKDNQPFTYTIHTYENGLNVRSDIFAGEGMKEHRTESFRTYDEDNFLRILEVNELWIFSSSMSYVHKYEYFEN